MRNSENDGVSVVFRRLEVFQGEVKVFAVNAQRHTACIGIILESQSHPSASPKLSGWAKDAFPNNFATPVVRPVDLDSGAVFTSRP